MKRGQHKLITHRGDGEGEGEVDRQVINGRERWIDLFATVPRCSS